MKDENGRGVIRLHDRTTHGGQVITASRDLRVLGLPVALANDLTECPICHGQFRILPENSTRRHPRRRRRVRQRPDRMRCPPDLLARLAEWTITCCRTSNMSGPCSLGH
ncbi:PAAR domain-containing protein [Burkholderia gladioli]|uniref:PAAR domain-containing protein n=1 Tax=Burkholderia gladioli TaxID=28095 RepID=UPI003C79E989